MRECLFDLALIILGSATLVVSWWLLTHLSDRRILRRVRPRVYFVQRQLTHDEAVAQRSLTVALAGVFFLMLGALCLMAGIMRLFGFGRG